MQWVLRLSQLNPRQREAVKYIDTPLLVLAGAGSGKTSVITRKIAYLIEQCEIPANRIVAVTFTNKASREMKERVGTLLPKNKTKGLTVSTFHNLGLKIIRSALKTVKLKPGFSIFDSHDSTALIKDILMRDSDEQADEIDLVRNTISSWKNDLVTAEEAVSYAENDHQAFAAQIYIAYDRSLRAFNAVDFDDLILMPALLFKNHPDVLQRWQNRVHYMLVDEYQDTNASQYLLVKLLMGVRNSLTVVGDDDQSIYAWRGAKPENLALLKEDFPSLHVIMLEQNYRSMGCILKAANSVIDNNPHVFEKKLWSELGYGDPIRIVRCKNEEQESERVATDIINSKLQTGNGFKDYAVLYRGNHQARLLEMKLQAFQIPYKLSGGTSFFGRAEIKDIMAYLRVIINPEDDNALLRIINTPRREIGFSTVEKLAIYANEREVSLLAACQEMGLQSILSERAYERVNRLALWFERCRENCYRNNPVAAIKEMINDIDYAAWLNEQASNAKVAERRMDNIWQLVKSIQTMHDKADEDSQSIEDVIAKLVLIDILEQQEEEDDSDRVQLMTLHAAKGLEFPHVYMMGVEEEILPHRTSVEEGNIEEERRLMYVGITRAKRTLTLTLAAQRTQYGEKMECSPSRFIDELPQDDLAWEGQGIEKSVEEKKEIGAAHLSNMRAMLAGLE